MGTACTPLPRPVQGWRWLFVFALCAIAVLALRPTPLAPPLIPHMDKLQHLAAFVMLWVLGRSGRIEPAWLAAGLLAYGVGIELGQSLQPTRDASVADIVADLGGIGVGFLWTRLLMRRRRHASQANTAGI